MQLKMLFLSIVAVLALITLIFILTSDKENKNQLEVKDPTKDNQQVIVKEETELDDEKFREIEENYNTENEEEVETNEILHADDEDYEYKYLQKVGKDYGKLVSDMEQLAKSYVTDEMNFEEWGVFLTDELLEEKKNIVADGAVKKVVGAEVFPIMPENEELLRFDVRVDWVIPLEGKEQKMNKWVIIDYEPTLKKVVAME